MVRMSTAADAPTTVPAIRTTWTVNVDLASILADPSIDNPTMQAAYRDLRETIDAAIFAAIDQASKSSWFVLVGESVAHTSTTVQAKVYPGWEF